MERRDFLKRAGLGAAGASAAVTGIGTLVSPAFAGGYAVPCPFLDNYEANGSTAGAALEDLTAHVRDAHTSDLPEPVRSEVKTKLTTCAHTLGTLPV